MNMHTVLYFFISHWKGVLITSLLIIFFIFIISRRFFRNARIRRVDRMTGEEFERFLYLKFKGMRKYKKVRHVGQSGDYGADLILYTKDGRKIIVQAKRYHGYVGIAAVQQTIGAVKYYDADEGWVVTNSTYSDAAKNMAAASNIKLYDRSFIYQLCNQRTKKDEEEIEEDPGESAYLHIRYQRDIRSMDGTLITAKLIENRIDEYLIDQGFEVIKKRS